MGGPADATAASPPVSPGQARTLPGYRWLVLALIMAIQTASSIGSTGLPALAPFIRDELHLTRQQAGSFVSAFYLGTLFTAFPSGWVADRIGVRGTLFVGQLLTAVFTLSLAGVHRYRFLMAAIIVAGVGFGIVNPTSTKAIIAWFPARARATFVGIKQTGFPLGGALGAFLLPPLALAFGWRGAIGISGVLTLASAAVFVLLYREAIPEGAPPGVAGGPRPRGLLRDPSILFLCIASFFFSAVQVTWISYLVLYLQEAAGLSIILAAAYLGQAQIAGTVGRVAFGYMSDRVFGGRRRITLFLTGSLTALLSLWMPAVSRATPGWLLVAVTILFGLAGIGWNGVHLTLLAELAGLQRAGSAVGLGLVFAGVGVILGPPLFGRLVDRSGSYQAAWLGLAGMMLVALLSLVPIREPGMTRRGTAT